MIDPQSGCGHGSALRLLRLLRAGTLVCMSLLFVTGCHKSRVANNPGYSPSGSAPELDADGDVPAPPDRATGADRNRSHQPAAPSAPFDPDHLDAANLGRPISTQTGLASWYGPPYHHRQAADGSIFDQNALTAAHRTLPLGTIVRVTNPATEQSVMVRITDRGPFVPGRILDLSLAAAKAIGVYRAGVAQVKIEAFAHPTADPAGHWCVQIGAFLDPDDAVQLKNDLKHRYQTAKVIEFAGPTGHWVRINPAEPDRETAAKIAETIHIPDAQPYLVRTN